MAAQVVAKKMEQRQQMSQGHTKVELELGHGDERSTGENVVYNQPYRLRGKIYLGRLTIKQIGGPILPVKQHP